MKKYTFLICSLLISLGYVPKSMAQRAGFTYQAVAIDRSKSEGFGQDSQGEVLANRDITLRFSLREGDENGEIKYQETHGTSTDVFGIFRLVIGRGENFSTQNLEDMLWGETPYFLQVEIDLGDGFVIMGVEELLGSPYALNAEKQSLYLEGNELSLTKGNMVVLNDNDASNELIQSVVINGNQLEITDAGGTKSVDLGEVIGEDLNDEIQDLQLSENILTITKNASVTEIDLSPYLDNTMLTEAEVDDFVSNNGYITIEVDGSMTNEIQNIITDNSPGNISLSDGSTLALNVDDADADASNELINGVLLNGTQLEITDAGGTNTIDLGTLLGTDAVPFDEIQDISTNNSPGNISLSDGSTLTLNVNDEDANSNNEIQDISLSGTELTISGGSTIDLSTVDTDTNTQLTETQVDVFVSDNGYLTTEIDGSTSNEIQDISTDNSAGNISLSDGSTLTLNVDDADANSNNEIQDISLSGTELTISSGSTIDLSAVDTDTNTQLTESKVDDFVSDNGYLTTEIDGSTSNEIQDISTNNAAGNITISDGSTISLNVNDADASATNEIQDISLSGSDLSISDGSTIDLSAIDTDTNTQLTESQVDAFIADNGYLTTEVDGSTSNEIQDISLSGTNLSISDGSTVDLSVIGDNHFNLIAGVISNENPDTDDFVFGSDQLDDDDMTTDDDIRMFFDKSSGAFRAGEVDGDQWDGTNVGSRSAAFGINTRASGSYATAFGNTSNASGNNSTAFGSSQATGNWSTSFGLGGFASGDYATSAGREARAQSYGEFALGLYITTYTPTSLTAFDPTDRLFVIGNGLGDGGPDDRRDALVMLKNGNTTLNGSLTIDGDNSGGGAEYTLPAQDGAAGHVMTTDGSGGVSWVADGGAFSTISSVTSNIPGDLSADDFVFGSNQLDDDDMTADDDFRMFFDKSKGAFRAGRGNSVNWDDANVGDASVAFGTNTIASGTYASAFGNVSTASGGNSTAFGHSEATGDFSTSSGHYSRAQSYGEFALGMYNTFYTSVSLTAFDPADRLFVIGNGLGDGGANNRRDAFVMLKNGNTTLNGTLTIDGDNQDAGKSYTLPAQDGNTNQILITDGSGNASWGNASGSGAFATTGGVTSNSPGNLANDDFVFGSTQLNDLVGTDDDVRMFFDKGKYAFRAGYTTGNQWDAGNVGAGSVAFGEDVEAAGWGSTAFGVSTQANGIYSFSAGWHARALGDWSIALGNNSEAGGSNSLAMGNSNIASGDYSLSMGHGSTASSNTSISMGAANLASGSNSVAFGFQSNSESLLVTVMGRNNVGGGDPMNWDDTDPLLEIGNGIDDANRSNALTILKDGNTTLNGSLTIDGDNQGAGQSWTLPSQAPIANGYVIEANMDGSSGWVDPATFSSDSRLKKNIQPLQEGLRKVLQLNGVNYHWQPTHSNDTISMKTGFIAQEIANVLPELVSEDQNGYKRVNYIEVIPYLVEAIKELKAENEKLRIKNEETEANRDEKIMTLESRLTEIEKILTPLK